MLDKLKAIGRDMMKSLTIAWSYLLAAVGAVMQYVDQLATLVNDSSFGQQVQTILGADPKTIGKWLMIVATINIVTRMRSMVFKPKD